MADARDAAHLTRPSAAVTLLLAAAAATAGCKTSTRRLYFPAEELQQLDGLRAGQKVELETTEGHVVEVTSKTMLRFGGPTGPQRKLRCEAIDIDGSLLACVNRAGLEERVDLSDTRAYVLIGTRKTSWGKVALYVVGVYAGIALIACVSGQCSE